MTNQIRSITVRPAAPSTDSTGLKGALFSRTLGGVDLLAGVNGSGKTTQSVLSLTAAVEGLAERPTDSRRPYLEHRPSNAEVDLEVHTPGGIEHLLRDLSSIRGAAVVQANADASLLIGTPPTAWDLSDFAGGTDGDRGKILDVVARAGGQLETWSVDDAVTSVRTIMLCDLDDGIDADEWTAPLDECAAIYAVAGDGAAWLKAALTWVTGQQKTSNRAQKDAKALAAELAAGLKDMALPEQPLVAAKAAQHATLQALAQLDSSTEAVAAATAALARHEAEGQRLTAELAAQVSEGKRLAIPADAPDTTVPADVVARLKAAQAAMDAPVPLPDGADLDALAAEVDKADADVAASEVALSVAMERSTAATTALSSITAELAAVDQRQVELDATHARLRADVAALESLSGTESTCAHCGKADPLGLLPRIAEARARADEAAAAVSALATERESVAARAATAQAEAAESGESEARAASHMALAAQSFASDALAAAGAAPAQHVAAVRAQRQTALDAAQSAHGREQAWIARAQAKHTKQEAIRTKALAEARGRYHATAAALAAWTETPAPVIPSTDTDDLKRETITTDLAAAEAVIEEWRTHGAATEAATRANDAYITARAEWDAVRAMLAAVRQSRDELAAAAYRPIHDAAQNLLSAAQSHGLPMPYFFGAADYGAEVVDQKDTEGAWTDEHGHRRIRVPYHDLSQSEAMITAAALVYALATIAGNPCRLVLLDGVEVVQRDHRLPLFAALVAARTAGLVDNVVMTMATEPAEDLSDYTAVAGLTVHDMSEPTASPMAAAGPSPAPTAAPTTTTTTNFDDCPF